MRRQKSLRNGVHHADGVVWEPVCRTRLNTLIPARASASSISPCSGAMNDSAVLITPSAMTSSTDCTTQCINSAGNSCGFQRSAP
eukprot:6563-Pelagococcus_subviridis.AAC.2